MPTPLIYCWMASILAIWKQSVLKPETEEVEKSSCVHTEAISFPSRARTPFRGFSFYGAAWEVERCVLYEPRLPAETEQQGFRASTDACQCSEITGTYKWCLQLCVMKTVLEHICIQIYCIYYLFTLYILLMPKRNHNCFPFFLIIY